MEDWVILPTKKELDAIEAKARVQQRREDEERIRRKCIEMETRRKAEEQLKINAAMKRDIQQLQEREKEREKKPLPSSQSWSAATKTMTLKEKSDLLQKMMKMEAQKKKDTASEFQKDLKRLAALSSAKKGGRKTRKFFNKKKKTMKRRKVILKMKTYKRK